MKLAWIKDWVVWATIIWGVLWAVVIGCHFLFSEKTLLLNEWGDLVAGISAGLAFLWLVRGYYQQRDELRLNTKELKRMSDEAAQQTKSMRESLSILKAESEANQASRDREFEPMVYTSNTAKDDNGTRLTLVNDGSNVTLIKQASTSREDHIFLPIGTMLGANHTHEIVLQESEVASSRQEEVNGGSVVYIYFKDRINRSGRISIATDRERAQHEITYDEAYAKHTTLPTLPPSPDSISPP